VTARGGSANGFPKQTTTRHRSKTRAGAPLVSRVTGKPLPVLGGILCLDFVNTIDPRLKPPKEEYLNDYDRLVQWARFVGLISDGQARGLAAWARSHKSKAASIHHRAIELREALYALFRRGTDVRRDLDVVNREATDLASAVRLDITSDGYSISWEQGSEILGPILQSAWELLTSPELARVRQCEGDGCGWVFVDRSRTHRRRWCSMAICGNRVKAKKNRQRAARPNGS